jgi:hypothetical protein
MHAGAVALITSAALLLGVLLWAGLALWQRRSPLTARSLFTVVLVVGILCRLAYVFLTPMFYAPDEQSHFNYIKYLAEHRAFPVLTKGLGDPANEWEYHQAPLYYLMLVPVYGTMQALFHHPAAAVFALRACSFLLWLLNVRLGLMLLQRLEIRDDLVWLTTMTLICLLPTYIFISSTINNDNLLITLGAGILLLLARQPPSLKSSLALGFLLGVALWVKQSAVVFLPAVGLIFPLLAFRRVITWRVAAVHLGLTLGLAALLYAPWAIRNWQLYRTLTPEGLSVAAKAWPSMLDGLASAAHNLVKTFWSVSGISNDVGYPFPLFGMGFMFLSVAGLAFHLKQHPKPTAGVIAISQGPLLAALVVAILINVLLVLRLGYLYGMGQGRHLFPLLYPIALLLSWGLSSIPARNATVHVVGFWVVYAIAFEAFSLSRFPW